MAVALVAGAGIVAWRIVRDGDDTRLTRAMALAPESTVRFSWTDWAAVREELGVDLSGTSPASDVEDFLLEAFDRDLTASTALDESAATIHTELGFSPATIDWELFAQGEDGAVVIMGLPEDVDVPALEDQLRTAGFTQPDEQDGVWQGGVDLLETLSGPVTPELAALQIDAEAGVLYGSDDPRYLAERADVARDDLEDGVAEAAAAAGTPLAASAYTGEHTCAELSMAEADPADRTRASELIAEAGEVHPLTGFAIAAQPGGDVRVALALDSEDQARTDADSRSRLAAGPAPGQGGAFPEKFTLGKVTAVGNVVTMDLAPVDGWLVLSDFNHGPVLFATC
ncbi:hypothetical protein ASE01_05690 [Nocardioides sp. Root190]|nr:hypothetical protein ASE01_05690 [Nocardioides sp. Root190]